MNPNPRPILREWMLVAALLLLALAGVAGGFWAASFSDPAPAKHGVPPRNLVDFTLVDRTGRTVNRADLTNQYLVVNFVSSSCSISCRQVNLNMGRIQAMVASQADVRLVSFTVDPRTDTPEVLAQFGRQFGADTNRWLLLTGDKQVLQAVIEDSFLGRPGANAASLAAGGLSHTDRIALMDARGRLRALINGVPSTAPRDITNLLAQLRRESPAR